MNVVKEIELTKTARGDKPILDCVISDSGIIEVIEPLGLSDLKLL